jgi:nitrous oxide reductase accessory protein NosL
MNTTYYVTVHYWSDEQERYCSIGYSDMPGPKTHAITSSIEQTRHSFSITDVSPEDCQAIPMTDWQAIQADAHKCVYTQGLGACDICGRAISGSPLWNALYGSEPAQ